MEQFFFLLSDFLFHLKRSDLQVSDSFISSNNLAQSACVSDVTPPVAIILVSNDKIPCVIIADLYVLNSTCMARL